MIMIKRYLYCLLFLTLLSASAPLKKHTRCKKYTDAKDHRSFLRRFTGTQNTKATKATKNSTYWNYYGSSYYGNYGPCWGFGCSWRCPYCNNHIHGCDFPCGSSHSLNR